MMITTMTTMIMMMIMMMITMMMKMMHFYVEIMTNFAILMNAKPTDQPTNQRTRSIKDMRGRI